MRSAIKRTSIVYVNFAPYENAGKIFDFLLERFDIVVSFRFNFHRLSGSHDNSKLTIYLKGKQLQNQPLYYMPTPPSIAFLVLPVRSFIIFLQILYYLVQIRRKYGVVDMYFTVNAFTAWCGNIAKKFNLVKQTVFWVWDYYPPAHPNRIVRFMRWLYWLFDKPASRETDIVVFLNKQLELLRRKMNILPKDKRYRSIGIGTDPIDKLVQKHTDIVSLVFLGVLKKSQGLDLVFDAFEKLEENSNIELHIIGGGPDEAYYKKRALTNRLRTVFHGYIADDTKVAGLVCSYHIGLATYVPDKSNVSYYTEPSKIKFYLGAGLPVITTNVFDFSKEIKKSNAGIVIPYRTINLLNAVDTIKKKYPTYQKAASELGKKYYYRKLYNGFFS